MAKKSGTEGMGGMGATSTKKKADMPPGMYGGRTHSPLGGGTETPRRGNASSGGISYNGNCK